MDTKYDVRATGKPGTPLPPPPGRVVLDMDPWTAAQLYTMLRNAGRNTPYEHEQIKATRIRLMADVEDATTDAGHSVLQDLR